MFSFLANNFTQTSARVYRFVQHTVATRRFAATVARTFLQRLLDCFEPSTQANREFQWTNVADDSQACARWRLRLATTDSPNLRPRSPNACGRVVIKDRFGVVTPFPQQAQPDSATRFIQNGAHDFICDFSFVGLDTADGFQGDRAKTPFCSAWWAAMG